MLNGFSPPFFQFGPTNGEPLVSDFDGNQRDEFGVAFKRRYFKVEQLAAESTGGSGVRPAGDEDNTQIGVVLVDVLPEVITGHAAYAQVTFLP